MSVGPIPDGAPGPVPSSRPVPAEPDEALPAWRRHAVPVPDAMGKPRIVVVIDDMGLDRRRSTRIAALPGPLTLAWLPYGRNLESQTKSARRNGHELIVHMPMEPEGSGDPGKEALLTTQDADEMRRRLIKNLKAFDGYVGINNHMGSRFTAHGPGMDLVLSEMTARGLLFLDSRTTAGSKAPALAIRHGVPFAARDVFLDNEISTAAIDAELRRVESIARHQGVAIAIGHPYDATADALAAWLPTLEEKGFQLVPISAVVQVPPAKS